MVSDNSGKRGRPAYQLDNSIDELEELLAERSRFGHDDIPVLDDVIDPGLYDESDSPELMSDWEMEPELPDSSDTTEGFSREEIEMLVGSMDQRISGELDELVNILKDAIKDSIMTEIKSQLENRPQDASGDSKDPSANH